MLRVSQVHTPPYSNLDGVLMCIASPNVSLSGKTTRLVGVDEGGDQFTPPSRGSAELIAAFA
jgi:hypothetical protein